MSLSLRSSITLAFSFQSNVISADAGAFIDHPFSNVTIQQLSTTNTDANCNGTDGIPIADADFDKLFKNLTHVAPAAGLKAGLDVHVSVNVPALSDKPFSTEWVLMEPAVPLPTACLAFQKGAFGTASAVLSEVEALASASASAAAIASASAKATGSGKGGAKKSSAERVSSPFKVVTTGSNGPFWTILFCGIGLVGAGSTGLVMI
jgi:hypothetical protein